MAAITETQSDQQVSPNKSQRTKFDLMTPLDPSKMVKSPTQELLHPPSMDRLEVKSSVVSPSHHGIYNSLSRLKDNAMDGADPSVAHQGSSLQLKYNQGKYNNKMRPVVMYNPEGDLYVHIEHKKHEHDYNFNAPIEQYYNDHKLNKLLYETQHDQKRYQTIQKMTIPQSERTFEEFYRKIKVEKIKPALEKDKKHFEARAKKYQHL